MHGSVVRTCAYELLADDTYRRPPPMSTKEADAVMPTEDIPTPSEEEFRAQAEELDQREADNIELLGEIDALRRQAEEAAAELEKMREQRDALARYIELIPDPMHQPSRPKDRPRFAGEDHDDYALRGE